MTDIMSLLRRNFFKRSESENGDYRQIILLVIAFLPATTRQIPCFVQDIPKEGRPRQNGTNPFECAALMLQVDIRSVNQKPQEPISQQRAHEI